MANRLCLDHLPSAKLMVSLQVHMFRCSKIVLFFLASPNIVLSILEYVVKTMKTYENHPASQPATHLPQALKLRSHIALQPCLCFITSKWVGRRSRGYWKFYGILIRCTWSTHDPVLIKSN